MVRHFHPIASKLGAEDVDPQLDILTVPGLLYDGLRTGEHPRIDPEKHRPEECEFEQGPAPPRGVPQRAAAF